MVSITRSRGGQYGEVFLVGTGLNRTPPLDLGGGSMGRSIRGSQDVIAGLGGGSSMGRSWGGGTVWGGPGEGVAIWGGLGGLTPGLPKWSPTLVLPRPEDD